MRLELHPENGSQQPVHFPKINSTAQCEIIKLTPGGNADYILLYCFEMHSSKNIASQSVNFPN